MMLALSMTMNVVSMQAFADEPIVQENTIQNEDGTMTEQTITTTTTTTTNPETGNVMLEVKIEENVTKDEDGNVLKESKVEDRYEMNESTEEVKPGQNVPSVDATIQYETNEDGTVKVDGDGNPIPKTDEDGNIIISGSVKGEPVIETTGDINSEEGQTTTTTTTDREVNGTISIEEKFEIIPDESKLECPVGPEDYEGKEYNDNPGNSINDRYFNDLLPGYNKDSFEENYVDPKPEGEGFEDYNKGYDLTWTGYGDATNAASAVFVEKLVYMTDENGDIVYENGFPVVDMEKSIFVDGQGGKSTDNGMVSTVGQFALKHENGEYFYAYCMDASTGASPNFNKWYNIRNLEDAIESEENPDGYLTEEDAGMIRAIVTNGYWGTESDRGSVESLKELLKETYTEETIINVRYPGSNDPHSYNIYELIDGLTEAEALVITQAAIWTYANNDDITYTNNKGQVLVSGANVIGALSALKCYNGGTGGKKISWLNEYVPAKDGESDARMQALYQCLLSLDPIYKDGELREDSTVIPNENVINDVALVIKDKVADEDIAANFDGNDDNDVYNTELNFKLAFVPGEKDEMYVCLMDNSNQPILGDDGQPIRKLLASEESQKQGDDVIKPVNGVYTLTGLKLSENSNFEFDLRLEGTQYLNEGVYIYQAEGGRRESQTLVGLAKGEQKVVVSNKMTISFDVDEENHVVAEREWHTEDSKEYVPQPNNPGGGDGNNGGGNDGGGSTTTTTISDSDVPLAAAGTIEISDNDVPLSDGAVLNIEDAPIPLAVLPMTGDVSVIWMLISLISGLGLAGVSLADWKKRR